MDHIEEKDDQLENSMDVEEINTDSNENVEDIPAVEDVSVVEEDKFEPEYREHSSYTPPSEPPKKKGNILVPVIAVILILGIVIFGGIKIFGNKRIPTVDQEVYDIGMKAVEFIENKKLLNADLMAAGGDLQTALGIDYLVIQNFDTIYNTVMSSSTDGITPINDTQYFVQMIGVALSAQVQQLALDSLITDINDNAEAWSAVDTSRLPEVADAYQRIWQNTTKLLKTGNMEKIKTYYDTSEWIAELEPLEEYLQYFDAQLSAAEEYSDEYLGDDYNLE